MTSRIELKDFKEEYLHREKIRLFVLDKYPDNVEVKVFCESPGEYVAVVYHNGKRINTLKYDKGNTLKEILKSNFDDYTYHLNKFETVLEILYKRSVTEQSGRLYGVHIESLLKDFMKLL